MFAQSADIVVHSSQTRVDIWKSVPMLKEKNSGRHTCLVLFCNLKCNSVRNGCYSPHLVGRCNVLTSDIIGFGLKFSNGKEHCMVSLCYTKILCQETIIFF